MAQLVALYGVSLLILAVYCVVVHQAFTTFGNKELNGITRWSAMLAALSVVVLDLVVRWALRCGLVSLCSAPVALSGSALLEGRLGEHLTRYVCHREGIVEECVQALAQVFGILDGRHGGA